MKLRLLGAACVCLLVSISAQANAAVLSSTFDTDDEGWTANPGEGSLTYFATGGNPGGHIQITDIGGGSVPFGSGVFVGPKFLGDLTAFDGGTISLDMATFAGGGGTFASFGAIQLSGGGDVAILDIAVVAPQFEVWETFSGSFNAASWGKSQDEWLAILSDVTSIGSPTDAFDGADTIGIDNFTIAAVPLPTSVLLFGSGLLGMIGISRKMKGSLRLQ
jgi:hypothetical protein